MSVEALLSRLTPAPPPDDDVWSELFGALVPQETLSRDSYAAVPALVRLGTAAPPDRQLSFWMLVGAIATASWSLPCPPDLREAYDAALRDADAPIRAAIAARPRDESIWYLLGGSAAIRGLATTARALEDFVASLVDVDCPSCGETVEIAREDAQPGPPLASRDPSEWRWTDDDAPVRLLALARLAGRADVEAVLLQWDGTVSCPHCDAPFRLRPAQLSTLRSWSD